MAFEVAQKQHLEALQQLEENMVGGPIYGPQHRPLPPEWSLKDFLKYQSAKFDGKTSLDLADQWRKDMERIFDAKRCLDESRLAYILSVHVDWRGRELVGQHEVDHGRNERTYHLGSLQEEFPPRVLPR